MTRAKPQREPRLYIQDPEAEYSCPRCARTVTCNMRSIVDRHPLPLCAECAGQSREVDPVRKMPRRVE